MTLMELTSREAGIIIYGGHTVGVFNWGRCDDNQIPVLSPFGEPIPWPEADIEACGEFVGAGWIEKTA